jgi:hypothetical protein
LLQRNMNLDLPAPGDGERARATRPARFNLSSLVKYRDEAKLRPAPPAKAAVGAIRT